MVLDFGKGMLFQAGTGVFTDSPEENSVQVWDGNRWTYEDAGTLGATTGTIALWQAGSVSGNMANLAGVNDGAVYPSSGPASDTIGEVCTVTFTKTVRLNQWRQYGYPSNHGDGVWKLQYYNLDSQSFVDWVTGIPTIGSVWSDWTIGSTIKTTKIQLVSVTLDTNGNTSRMCELEVLG